MPLVSVQLVVKTISHLSRGRNSRKVMPVPGLERYSRFTGAGMAVDQIACPTKGDRHPDNSVKRVIIHQSKPRQAANPPHSRAAPDQMRRWLPSSPRRMAQGANHGVANHA